MIAKRVPARKDGKSSFQQLGNYILDQKHGGEKVAAVSVTNCQSDSPEWAMLEIEATQAINTRAKSDRNYHLVVAFPEGETPSPEQLADIEKEICQHVGLGDHQRVSAFHTDTDHNHLHIAINKVHPETHRLIEPYYDHYRLAEACAALEVKHGLTVVNHDISKKTADRKPLLALDEMRAGGRVPLADWLTKRLDSPTVKSWDELHKSLAAIGASIEPRGRGLVFKDNASGLTVKASAVNRDFSLSSLTKTFGDYQAPSPEVKKIQPQERYSPSPGQGGSLSRAALWDQFSRERDRNALAKREALADIKADIKQQREGLTQKFKVKRLELKNSKTPVVGGKKGQHSLLKMQRLAELDAIAKIGAEARQAVNRKFSQPDWRDWLKERADQGDENALEALRNAKPRKTPDNRNQVEGQETDHSIYKKYTHHVHRDGRVTYRFGGGDGFTDDGKKLSLGNVPSDQAIEAALKMAVQKYGQPLKIGGSEEFKLRAQAAARNLKIKLSGVDTQPPASPLSVYVNERNSKRATISDILEHRLAGAGDFGTFKLSGLRNINGKRAALLEKNRKILVKEVSEAEYKSMKALKIGSPVTLDKSGKIKQSTTRKRE